MSVVPLCDGGAVVVHGDTLDGFVLNPVGAFVYARMAAGERELPALVAAVAARFDAPLEEVEADVARFVGTIRRRLEGLPGADSGRPG